MNDQRRCDSTSSPFPGAVGEVGGAGLGPASRQRSDRGQRRPARYADDHPGSRCTTAWRDTPVRRQRSAPQPRQHYRGCHHPHPDHQVAILNDTSITDLGTLTLREVRTSGQVLLLARDKVRAGHVQVKGLTVDIATGSAERPVRGSGVLVSSGVSTTSAKPVEVCGVRLKMLAGHHVSWWIFR
jgi:hypothetical protein